MSRPQEQVEDQGELEEEVVSGNGEADEIMDEVEEGYSEFHASIVADALHSLASLASSTPTSTLTWISWFCSLPGHEYFCEVSEDFIEDDFNLTGLNTMVPFWKEAMEMVLDVEPGMSALGPWELFTHFTMQCRRRHIENPGCFNCGSIGRTVVRPRASALYPDASRLAVHGLLLPSA